MSKNEKMDLFKILSTEAESYRTIDQIETLVDEKYDLAPLPVQPLYLAIKSLPVDRVAEYLPRLSPDQRTAFLDIDLWQKDELDVEQFQFWVQAYWLCQDDQVKLDFVKSDQFGLFLKGKFNVWTFDVEDPEYPDHDSYFLTEDSLLLVEYEENYPYVQELKEMIRMLYADLGVENAYAYLFKIVSDGFLTLQEDEYHAKKERLRDIGFVDYFDALDIDSTFVHFEQLHGFLLRKAKEKTLGVEVNDYAKNQTLHLSSLIPFRDHFNSVVEELNKVKDQRRVDFLQFNFVRLLNAEIELNSALKRGSLAMNRTGASVKNILTLAINYMNSTYIRSQFLDIGELSIFDKMDFVDVFRVGNSLLKIPKKDLKKALAKNGFEEERETFLGKNWEEFLDLTFDEETKFISATNKTEKAQAILSFEDYEEWRYKVKALHDLLPFAQKFYETFETLKNEGKIHDSYYLNYTVDSIDFEALLLSSFANHFLGTYQEENTSKLGLTIDEFKSFATKIISSEGKFILTPELYQKIQFFMETFGLKEVAGFNNYLQKILQEQLEGYEYDQLDFDDFKHVGGPIILNRHRH